MLVTVGQSVLSANIFTPNVGNRITFYICLLLFLIQNITGLDRQSHRERQMKFLCLFSLWITFFAEDETEVLQSYLLDFALFDLWLFQETKNHFEGPNTNQEIRCVKHFTNEKLRHRRRVPKIYPMLCSQVADAYRKRGRTHTENWTWFWAIFSKESTMLIG
jgi:hypothetical protein